MYIPHTWFPQVKRQRHALGRLFRQFGLDQFRMSRYILQHRQALFTPAYKREAMLGWTST